MKKLKNFVKNNKIIYAIYYVIMSLIVNIIKLFVRTDEKLILFVSYGGRHYNDSPKNIYEYMKNDERFKDYKLVWAFVEPEKFDVDNKIKIDTIKYYKTALKARCWVTNVMVERALKFRGKKTFYFYTTHGVLIKLMGKDLRKGSSFDTFNKLQYDYCIVQSEYEKKIVQSQYDLTPEKIGVIGFPKNDILVNYSKEFRDEIRNKLGIPNDKKAILYAPTFRDTKQGMIESRDIDVDMWKKELGEEFVLLYRAHPVISGKTRVNDDFFFDVSKYEIVEELMIASDCLISDYSGIIFDYSIMRKPIFLYTYDYEEYNASRGLYFDIRKELPYAMNEEDLVNLIANGFDNISDVVLFQEKYATVYGDATKKSVELIVDNIKK